MQHGTQEISIGTLAEQHLFGVYTKAKHVSVEAGYYLALILPCSHCFCHIRAEGCWEDENLAGETIQVILPCAQGHPKGQSVMALKQGTQELSSADCGRALPADPLSNMQETLSFLQPSLSQGLITFYDLRYKEAFLLYTPVHKSRYLLQSPVNSDNANANAIFRYKSPHRTETLAWTFIPVNDTQQCWAQLWEGSRQFYICLTLTIYRKWHWRKGRVHCK